MCLSGNRPIGKHPSADREVRMSVNYAKFQLHSKLATDTLLIGDWPLCRILLMNDNTFPWLILVPRIENVCEIIDLKEIDQQQLILEISRASRSLKAALNPDKLNIAALGNVVSQLHIHLIARYKTDSAWPRPIWGSTPSIPFGSSLIDLEITKFKSILGPFQ